jgi:hypothetical protein
VKPRDLERIEDELGLELPEDYRQFVLSFSRARAVEFLIFETRPSRLIRLNESLADGEPPAGLRRWPDSFFVFGDDGSGNYYLLDIARPGPPVIYYDHERDELIQRSKSLKTFVTRLVSGKKFEARVLHSGPQAERMRQGRERWKPPAVRFGRNAPRWQTDWSAFVDEFERIITQGTDEADRARRIQRKFSSKWVCWTGEVAWLDLGTYPSLHMQFEACEREVSGLRLSFGRQPLGLRFSGPATRFEAVSSATAWRKVDVGCLIKVLIRIAPGDEATPCIAMRGWYQDQRREVMLVDCGAHVVEITAKAPPPVRRNWRIIEVRRLIAGEWRRYRRKVLKRGGKMLFESPIE